MFLHDDWAKIEEEILALATERQWLNALARKGTITIAGLEQKLGILTLQDVRLKRELTTLGQTTNVNVLNYLGVHQT